MAASDTPSTDVLRWYTRARRVPQLVGKLPGSERGIPGGPYTLTQLAGAGVTFWLASRTTPLWTQWQDNPFHMLFELPVQILAALAAAFALRLIKPGGRDPLSALIALVRVWLAVSWGQHAGRPVRARRACRTQGQPRLLLSTPPDPGGDSTESTGDEPAPTGTRTHAGDSTESPGPALIPRRQAPAAPVTALQRMLTPTTGGPPDA